MQHDYRLATPLFSEELYRKRGKTGQMVMKEGKVTMLLHEESYQIDKHLEFMDEAGIDIAVLLMGIK